MGGREARPRRQLLGPVRRAALRDARIARLPRPDLAAHRVLARLEVELMHHGGNENGKLAVPYQQFEDCGVERHAIGPALRELEALGFVEIVERGVSGNAAYRKPNIYRLTYRPAVGAPGDGSHEWKRIGTEADALRVQKVPPV